MLDARSAMTLVRGAPSRSKVCGQRGREVVGWCGGESSDAPLRSSKAICSKRTRHDQPNPNSVEISRIRSASICLEIGKGWVAPRQRHRPNCCYVFQLSGITPRPHSKTFNFSAWIHGLGNGDRSQHLHAFARGQTRASYERNEPEGGLFILRCNTS